MAKGWQRWQSFLIACGLSLLLGLSGADHFRMGSAAEVYPQAETYTWNLPDWVPRPVVPQDNPMRQTKVELGRYLFYDQRLSQTGTMSCGSCHLQSLAFSDGQAQAVGATGEVHPRNSMSLTNVAYLPVLTWANPLQTNLEDQALVPLFGEHPVEMGMAGREDEILTLLQTDPRYQQQFPVAFPTAEDPYTIRHLVQAIAAFERTLNSVNSPYDRYRFGGDMSAISESAQRGEALFHSERLECFHCHGGFNFTDSIVHERLAFQEIAFHNTGLYNIDGEGSYPYPNQGVYEITHKPEDMGRFRAPTLRNIALTAPYMHDGSIATLAEVIDHYAAGGRTLHAGVHAGVGSESPLKSTFIKGFDLSPQERQDLLAFLHSLTDEQFITDPTLSDPFSIHE
jgi:cytochrome c peroxidase